MLVELSIVEQRYHAVMEVLSAGAPKTEVAQRYGVSRKTVHEWVRKYEAGGLAGLADRSHRPHHHPWQIAAEVEAAICELRRSHPRWGPRRLAHELDRAGISPVPSRSSIYRALVRHGLVTAATRKRARSGNVRWARPESMQLWQLDIMGSVMIIDPTAAGRVREVKLISGIDDHSRFCVIATVVPRATSRAVCTAFLAALARFGVPEQVLTDNGVQFTGKYLRPRPTEVLFDQICRHNGIDHLLTKIRSPTTTGKIERWHQSIQTELLDAHGPFDNLAAAQSAVDAWVADYNHTRPHQARDMDPPARHFIPVPAAQRALLPLWTPPEPIGVPDTDTNTHTDVDVEAATDPDGLEVSDLEATDPTPLGQDPAPTDPSNRAASSSNAYRSELTRTRHARGSRRGCGRARRRRLAAQASARTRRDHAAAHSQCSAATAPASRTGPRARFRSAFIAYVEWGTRIAKANSAPGANPPTDYPTPRWGWGEAPPSTP